MCTNDVKLKIRDDATHVSSRSFILCGQSGRNNVKIAGVGEVKRCGKSDKGEIVVVSGITRVFYFSGKVQDNNGK
jgi:hypothetical protein